jgi:hypothetical protein
MREEIIPELDIERDAATAPAPIALVRKGAKQPFSLGRRYYRTIGRHADRKRFGLICGN